MSDLVHPLQSLIQQAARTVPARTGATEHYRQRFERAQSKLVIVCDVSGSMAEQAGQLRKIDHLHGALDTIAPDLPPDCVGIAFGSAPRAFDPHGRARFMPAGGTALDLALEEAGTHAPARTLVVSDGRPDSEDAALRAARALSGRIDVIYCGPEDDTAAIAFMRRLAAAGGGRVLVHDLLRHAVAGSPLLAKTMRRALALPPARETA